MIKYRNGTTVYMVYHIYSNENKAKSTFFFFFFLVHDQQSRFLRLSINKFFCSLFLRQASKSQLGGQDEE